MTFTVEEASLLVSVLPYAVIALTIIGYNIIKGDNNE